MDKNRTTYISKLDAAKRQLEHCIKLFFYYGDIVVIHILASGAENILNDLATKQDLTTFRTELMNYIKPEYKDFIWSKFKEAWNFFKHANQDPDKNLAFNPYATEIIIWGAVDMYQKITGEVTPTMMSYRAYFYRQHQNIITDEKLKIEIKKMNKLTDPSNRHQYIDTITEYEKLKYSN